MFSRSFIAIGLCLVVHSFAAEQVEPLSAPEAVRRINETVTVQMTVQSVNDQRKEAGLIYLDSTKDFRDPENLAIVINRNGCGRLKEAGIEDPVTHYRDKVIRVTGLVLRKKIGAQLIVNDPRQIVIQPGK